MNRLIRASCAGLLLLGCAALWAQQAPSGGRGIAGQKQSGRAQAPFDLTGYWVSIISQDWIYRTVVLQRGQYTGVPINLKARQFADAWKPGPDEAAGKQCEAYGAAAIMWLPERLDISWQDANTLRVDTDTGMQTRLLRFDSTASNDVAPSWQGDSRAQWRLLRGVKGGWLKVVTNHILAGLLRKNGVPYSGQTQMTENWVINSEKDGDRWLSVTTILHDPVYLQAPYVHSSVFKAEPDGSKWDPSPCSLR